MKKSLCKPEHLQGFPQPKAFRFQKDKKVSHLRKGKGWGFLLTI